MRRIMVVAVAAVAVGGAAIATSAIGQGSGGTVGPRATGTLEVQFRFTPAKRTGGINPAVPRNKRRPKVADIFAGNGTVRINGERVGRVHAFDVVTFEGARRYRGGAELIQPHMLDFGSNNLLLMTCRASDDRRSNPCGVTGGTGDFAGARGTAVVHFPSVVENRREQIIRVTFTFIP